MCVCVCVCVCARHTRRCDAEEVGQCCGSIDVECGSVLQTLLKTTVSLETAAPYVSGAVLPIASQPVTRLCEAVRKTRAWVDDVLAAQAEDGTMELAAAEALLARTSKVPMRTEAGTALLESVTRASKARDVIRASLVPYAPVAVVKDGAAEAAVAGAGEKGVAVLELSAKAPADVVMVDGEGSGGNASAGDQENAVPREIVEVAEAGADASVLPKPPRMLDRDFKELQQLAATLRLRFPELQVLAESVQRVEAWKERARVAGAARTALGEVEALLEAAGRLPVSCAEADALAGVVASATRWIAQARTAMNGRRPLKEMRKLLHTGERMPVEMEAAEELKQCIRRREWEDSAGKVLAGKGTASAAAGILADAPRMGVAEDAATVQALTAALAEAEAWDSSAAELFERRDAAAIGDGAAGAAPTLDDIASSITKAAALRLRPERQSALVGLQTQAHGWLEDCARKMAPGGKPPAIAVVEALAATGVALGLSLRQLTDLQAQLVEARQVSADAATLLAQPAAVEQGPGLEALRAAAAALPVVVPEVEGMKARAAALSWEARAKADFAAVLSPPPPAEAARPKLEDVCEAVEEARELEVSDGIRVALRDAALRALVWETTAAMLLGNKPCAPHLTAPLGRCWVP